MTYRIEPKPRKCQSYGGCLAIAPKVFGWDRAHKVRLVDRAGAPEAAILKAAKLCPYRAIVLSDEASGQTIFPQGGS